MQNEERIALSIDPGHVKCGLAVVGEISGIRDRKIVATKDLENALKDLINSNKPTIILLGSGTHSKIIRGKITPLIDGLSLEVVNEKHSTERARLYYFRLNPPRGLWKLIPLGLRVPKEPYDDLAAVILAEDYFHKNL